MRTRKIKATAASSGTDSSKLAQDNVAKKAQGSGKDSASSWTLSLLLLVVAIVGLGCLFSDNFRLFLFGNSGSQLQPSTSGSNTASSTHSADNSYPKKHPGYTIIGPVPKLSWSADKPLARTQSLEVTCCTNSFPDFFLPS